MFIERTVMKLSLVSRTQADTRRAFTHPIALICIALALQGCASVRDHRGESPDEALRLVPPKDGTIRVAFLLAQHAEVVDFAGPWGVFEYANIEGATRNPFELYTVAESKAPIICSGGMTIVPSYTFADAPQPTIIVVPAMGEPPAAMLAWLRATAPSTTVTMSVCNGSFVLAEAGLLSGRTVTAHHGAYGMLAATYPDVTVRRGARFVDSGAISTAGGLTSGIDLALHLVERYFGRDAAERTARDLEYQGTGWKDKDSNVEFAVRPVSTEAHPVCPVCEMAVGREDALVETYQGQRVFFCSSECKEIFARRPEAFRVR